MKQLSILSHPEFGEVRSSLIKGEPWFVAKDVCGILGYSNNISGAQMRSMQLSLVAEIHDNDIFAAQLEYANPTTVPVFIGISVGDKIVKAGMIRSGKEEARS